MLVLPKVIPVNVQKTAETWPFWVKPHSDSHPHAPLLFQRGEFMAVPVWVSSASSRVRTQPSRLERPVTAYGGGTQRTPGESDSTRRDRSAPGPRRNSPLDRPDDQDSGRLPRELGTPGEGEGFKHARGHPAQKRAKLGRTSGVLAVGAWSARREIAEMLQEGVPAEDIIKAIQIGEESDHQLVQHSTPLREEGLNRGGIRVTKETDLRENRAPAFERGPKTPGAYGPWRASSRAGSNAGSSDKNLPASGRDGVPSWVSANTAGIAFTRKALEPEELVPSPSTPLQDSEEEESEREQPYLQLEVKPVDFGFRKRAVPQPPSPPPRVESHQPLQRRRPTRHNPLDLEKLSAFQSMCLKIFEDLVILQVNMDLVDFVTVEGGSSIDEEKFKIITEPRSPGTGLRYARLMVKYIEKVSSESSPEKGPCSPFSIQAVQREILSMISEESGFMTPLSFIYALEHFSAVFGFASPGSKHPRCKKLALDYSKKSPEKRQAPPFSVAFLGYLEKAVLDESKKVEHRLVLGKLRLCTQASVRHSDLATTALSRVEWCRVIGEKAILGLRAKAGKTKSGPRPWAASWLGVRPENDRWLFVLADILLKVHGGSWATHGFLGCASDGKGSFAATPPCIGEDVTLAKQALMDDFEAGRSIPLSELEIKGLRWHSCKNTLTTLMVHTGIKSRSIRYQGAWRKASETMIDLYLREAQILVIKAQMEVLDQVRRGVTLSVLEGRPLNLVPGASCWESPEEMFKGGAPNGVHPEEAVRAMDAAVVCVADPQEGEVKIRGSASVSPEDLPEAFRDPSLGSEAGLEKKIMEERAVRAECMEKLNKEVESEMAESDSDDGLDSDDSEAEPAEADMSLLPFFICSPSGTGKVHRPGESVLRPVEGFGLACGVQGKRFAALTLSENWGRYALCERCFGKPSGCPELCSYEVYKNGEPVRCARRCAPEAIGGHPEDARELPLGMSHRCALHAEVKDD